MMTPWARRRELGNISCVGQPISCLVSHESGSSADPYIFLDKKSIRLELLKSYSLEIIHLMRSPPKIFYSSNFYIPCTNICSHPANAHIPCGFQAMQAGEAHGICALAVPVFQIADTRWQRLRLSG
jgi:hypothetical protein